MISIFSISFQVTSIDKLFSVFFVKWNEFCLKFRSSEKRTALFIVKLFEKEKKENKKTVSFIFYCHFDWKVWIHYCSTVENDGNWFLFIFDTYNTEMNFIELCSAFVRQNSIFNFIVQLNTVQMNYNGYQWINRVQFINISKTSGKVTNIMENGFSFKEMRIERERERKTASTDLWTMNKRTQKWWKKDELAHVQCKKMAIIHTVQIEQVLNSELKSKEKTMAVVTESGQFENRIYDNNNKMHTASLSRLKQ